MRIEKIVEAVIDESRRPDMQSQAVRAVRSIITQVHTAANFNRDLIEDMVQVNPAHVVKITLPANFRKFKAIVPLTPEGMPIKLTIGDGTLEQIPSNELLTPGGNLLQNCYYVAGATATLRCQYAVSKYFISYWASPNLSDPKLETWLMAQNPELFITGAVAKVLSKARQEAQARAYESDFNVALAQAITDNIGV